MTTTDTVIWSAVAFATAYGGVMATGSPTGVFSWSALVAGLTALSAYHFGRGQQVGGVVNAAQKAIDA